MKASDSRNHRAGIVFMLIAALVFSLTVTPGVRAQSKLPRPTAHVTDLAGVVTEPAKQQLENMLANLQQRSGVNFSVVTVQSTGGQEIFDYAAGLAHEWNIGAVASPGKSLLLVVSTDEKTFATRFSRAAQKDLPEGALADMNEQMRRPLNSGQVSEALLLGAQKLITALSSRLGFSTDAMDQPANNSATAGLQTTNAPDTAARTQIAAPAPAAATEVKPTETQSPALADNAATRAGRRKQDSTNASLAKPTAANTKKQNTPADDEAEAEQVDEMARWDPATRVEKLKEFLAAHPDSKAKAHAIELLIGARAAVGDDKLKAGDNAGGLEMMSLALADAGPEMSDKLFSGVVSQIPINLYMRGERTEALKAARAIETKIADTPKRLVTLAGFYMSIERGDEAARLATQAVKLAPDLADAHNALGLALHISLRLDEAAAEYKRALELDATTRGARRALADLDRSSGKFDEALALYREQLSADRTDKGARVGMVLSLLELGKIDEGKQELQAAANEDARNLLLLTGAAYWFVAHGDSRLALSLAEQAVSVEPRYTWAQIAAARALVAEKQPLSAERALRFAQQYGRFPTLDYELASTLASMGLYEEAGDLLARSFTVKDGQIETQLANRIPAKATSFTELLALERRAGIFQATAADSEENARTLKSLLVFNQALNTANTEAKPDESAITGAAREFAGGKDEMRVYRQIYAASRLVKRGIGFPVAQELADAARDGVDKAVFVPAVTVAVQADELRDIRSHAIAAGGTPDIPDAPLNLLANILRGKIEDLSGWALFNQDKRAEAVEHLRRAVGVLPENTPGWQAAVWHLGAALQQVGNDQEALSFYIKVYNSAAPDAARRAVIEQLYKKVNGSLEGLDDRIRPANVIATSLPESSPTPAPTAAASPTPEAPPSPKTGTDDRPAVAPQTSPASSAATTPGSAEAVPSPAPTPTPGPTSGPETNPSAATPAGTPSPQPTPAATPEATPEPSPAAAPAPTPTPAPDNPPSAQPSPSPTPAPEAAPTPGPQASPSPTPEPSPTSSPTSEAAGPAETPSPSPRPSPDTRPRRVKPPE